MNMLKDMIQFLDESVTSYQAVAEIKKRLEAEGFLELQETNVWNLVKGKKYYVTRNQSSILAFTLGERLENFSFNIVSSHSDAPSFKIKPKYSIVKENMVQLNTEVYGGPLYSTWMDRLLGIAGRVLVREESGIQSKLVFLDQPCGLIPNMAIHMNRAANDGMKYDAQIDLLPLVSTNKEFDLMDYVAQSISVKKEEIIDKDLYLFPLDKARVWGDNEEFISSYHLDDLQCAYTTLQGFLKGSHPDTIGLYCCFDNEEVGSGTRQGAAGTFLSDVLERIRQELNFTEIDFKKALSSSLMISADNAHAYHPNHPEKMDPTNVVYLNKGVVIKYNANQSYATDGLSAALFREICDKANIPLQVITNRSGVRGGGTLGPVSIRQVSIPTVDVGLPQLAMHSTYETAGAKDGQMMIDAVEEFFNTHVQAVEDGQVKLLKREG